MGVTGVPERPNESRGRGRRLRKSGNGPPCGHFSMLWETHKPPRMHSSLWDFYTTIYKLPKRRKFFQWLENASARNSRKKNPRRHLLPFDITRDERVRLFRKASPMREKNIGKIFFLFFFLSWKWTKNIFPTGKIQTLLGGRSSELRNSDESSANMSISMW